MNNILKLQLRELAARSEQVVELARGEIAEAAADGLLKSLNPVMRKFTPQGWAAFPVPVRGSDQAKEVAGALRKHRANRKLANKNQPHYVNSDQDIYRALYPALFAARSEQLKEFAGGYVNTSQGVLEESGAGGHFNRNYGAYTGTLLFPGVGTAIGALIDLNRRKKNRIYTEEENPISDRTAASLARGFGMQD